jgi:acetolactate synthase-1/2/3 large subunit
MEMADLTGGQLVVRSLQREGVELLFGICGGHIAAIYDALKDSDIQLVSTRHEQAAVMMAEAGARLTRRPGAALVTAGPGFTNALTAVANAKMAGVPLVVMAGCVATDMVGRLDLQELDQLKVIEPLVKWARREANPARIEEALHEAFAQARSGAPGPVYLEFPADTLSSKIPEGASYPARPAALSRPAGDPERVAEVVRLLENCERPLLIAGSGVWFGDGMAALQKFAESSGVPVFTSSLGKGCLSDDHALCFGPSLPLRPGAAIPALTRADLVLLVGTRVSLFLVYGRMFAPTAKLVAINLDQAEIGRNRPVEVGIVGDAGRVLEQLTQAGAGRVKPSAFAAWREELQKAEAASKQAFKAQEESEAVPIHPARLAHEVAQFLGPDDIIAFDGGDAQIWMGMARRFCRPGHTLESGLFGCLGVGLPYAVGAQLVYPNKRVVATMGDGAMGFNLMELHTAISLKLPIVAVIFNDRAWGMVMHSQTLLFGKARQFGVELGDVPYHKLCEALGGYGEEVKEPKEIRPALERAFASKKTAVINVAIDPEVISPGSFALAAIGQKVDYSAMAKMLGGN